MLKSWLVNTALVLAILLLLVVVAFAVLLLVRGVSYTVVAESPGPQGGERIQETIYGPYPAAILPLLGALLCLLALWRRKLALAWAGLAILIVFSLLFLFSSGAALLPIVGALLILFAILQFNQRGINPSSSSPPDSPR